MFVASNRKLDVDRLNPAHTIPLNASSQRMYMNNAIGVFMNIAHTSKNGLNGTRKPASLKTNLLPRLSMSFPQYPIATKLVSMEIPDINVKYRYENCISRKRYNAKNGALTFAAIWNKNTYITNIP